MQCLLDEVLKDCKVDNMHKLLEYAQTTYRLLWLYLW